MLKMMAAALAASMVAVSAPVAAAPSPAAPPAIAIELRVRVIQPVSTPPALSNRASGAARQGIPLPQIVAGLQAMEPYRDMRYLGIERFDPRTGIYALRFLNGRQIIVVLVDGRSGRIIDRGF
jgi:hypothetical protein